MREHICRRSLARLIKAELTNAVLNSSIEIANTVIVSESWSVLACIAVIDCDVSIFSLCPAVSVELDRRIDFELREGLVESRYWSAVTSHTAYWCSYDIALFLLTFMYGPNSTNESAEDHPES